MSWVHGLQVFILNNLWEEKPSDWQEHEDDDGEDHLDVGPGGEAKHAEDRELHDLAAGEDVHLSLRNSLDVVVGRICGLLCQEQGHSLKHLVSIEGGDCHVKEEAVKDSFWNVGKNFGEEEHTETDGHVGENVGESGLADVRHDIFGVAALHSGLDVSEATDVEGGVGKDGVHEGKPEDGEDGVDDGDHHQVPVVGVAFLQFVFGAVDHGRADVLVHEEEDGEREAKDGGEEGATNGDVTELERMFELERLVPGDILERVEFDVMEELGSNEAEDYDCDGKGVV